MLGIIGIEKLEVMTVIGVYPDERKKMRKLLIDLKVEADVAACVQSDHLKDALDYSVIALICEEVAKKASFALIEAFAHALIEAIFLQFAIDKIWVKVTKPGALPSAAASFVELQRTR